MCTSSIKKALAKSKILASAVISMVVTSGAIAQTNSQRINNTNESCKTVGEELGSEIPTLSATFDALRDAQVVRGSFETLSQFELRRGRAFSQFSTKRTYLLSAVSNPGNNNEAFFYHPDSGRSIVDYSVLKVAGIHDATISLSGSEKGKTPGAFNVATAADLAQFNLRMNLPTLNSRTSTGTERQLANNSALSRNGNANTILFDAAITGSSPEDFMRSNSIKVFVELSIEPNSYKREIITLREMGSLIRNMYIQSNINPIVLKEEADANITCIYVTKPATVTSNKFTIGWAATF